MSQKGGIALILLILVVVAGIGVGAYFIVNNTAFFPKANQKSSFSSYPSIAPSPKATPLKKIASPSAVYENPFEDGETYTNPFDESYENPFNNL